MTNVYVQVPAFHEGDHFYQTLPEIASQEPPEGMTLTFEAWVTPGCDDLSNCRTWQAAENTRTVDAYEAPVGKLATRNTAHAHAVNEGADIIVAWDADAPPAHKDVLRALLTPYQETDAVVATNGNPTKATLVGPLISAVATAEDVIRPHFNSQLMSLSSFAWAEAGPFDTDLDQTDVSAVRQEEEFDFYDRVSGLGEIAAPSNATVVESPRRQLCTVDRAFSRFGMRTHGYCNRIGERSFHPRKTGRNRPDS